MSAQVFISCFLRTRLRNARPTWSLSPMSLQSARRNAVAGALTASQEIQKPPKTGIRSDAGTWGLWSEPAGIWRLHEVSALGLHVAPT